MTLAQNIAHWMFFEGSRLTLESNWSFEPSDIHEEFGVLLDENAYDQISIELLKNPYVLDVEKLDCGEEFGFDVTFSSLFSNEEYMNRL